MTKRFYKGSFEEEPLMKKPVKFTQRDETVLDGGDPGDLSLFLNDKVMIDNLRKNGIQSLYPVQQATFNIIFKGHDLTARDKTGSGKTLAYALPSLQRLRVSKLLTGKHPKILVMVPTRELAIQVRSCFQKLVLQGSNLKIVAVYGGDGIRNQIEALNRGADVIVATPGRLIDFSEKKIVQFDQLECVILDEADEMLKQGFKEDIEKIFKMVMDQTSKKPQTLLFSATIPDWVKDISEKYQKKNCTVIDLIGNSEISVPKTIKHFKYAIRGFEEIPETVKKICEGMASKDGRVIIFCETKKDVATLYESMEGMKCQMLHGDVKQRDRERIYQDFKSGKILRIVATNVAARGLDFPKIELVIQVQPPKQVQAYIHRAGRTGRAGNSGVSVVLWRKKNQERLFFIEKQGGFHFEELRERDLARKC